jgi:S-DNA-T family DNA segregation ATPase FtsK/SpoIIIE
VLFRKDYLEDDEDEFTIDGKPSKLSRKEKLEMAKKQEELKEKMKEKGSFNVDSAIRTDKSDQIEFDISKLGGKPSEVELEGKQKRDEFFKLQKEQKEDKSIKEVLTLDHTKYVEDDNYEFPPIELLNMPAGGEVFDKKAIHATAVKLQKTLASFGVEAKVTNITKGPTVTRYELTPNTGVKVSKIVNLSDDIALNLAAKSIRIEAPIPGRAAVGIEVPNAVCESVYLREVIASNTFKDHKSKLAFALGKDAAGEIVVGDIAKMPHVLIAGATGSGKSVCINSLIVSILYKSKPSEVKMILIDPKMVELSGYNGIPHLLIPVVTEPKKAAGALNWAVQEMVNRYTLFASKGVKDIKSYNTLMESEESVKLPQIVIIVDELADLMMVAPNDVEDAICRLAQMARAAGMHLVIATQRPSVDVITGIIKANIPSRIACTVSSQVDSRTILDMAGAEKLLGRGDMLYFPVGETKPLRVQGTFISEKEIEEIVQNIKENTDVTYSEDIIESIEKANIKVKGEKKAPDTAETVEEDGDPILNDAIDMVVDMGQASVSMLQRRFKIGYSRAGRIIDQMEDRGLISGYDGSKPRQVLISKNEWQELKMAANGGTESSNNSVSDNNIDYDLEN